MDHGAGNGLSEWWDGVSISKEVGTALLGQPCYRSCGLRRSWQSGVLLLVARTLEPAADTCEDAGSRLCHLRVRGHKTACNTLSSCAPPLSFPLARLGGCVRMQCMFLFVCRYLGFLGFCWFVQNEILGFLWHSFSKLLFDRYSNSKILKVFR